MIRKLTKALAGAIVMIASPAAAQDPVGYWQGTLVIGEGLELTTGVMIERGEDGALTGSLDSPDQYAFRIPLDQVELADGRLAFTVPDISASYEGTWDSAAQAWNGTFRQGGRAAPLVLTAGEPPERRAPPPLSADWRIPGNPAIGELLETRIAERGGAGMVAGVLEPGGTRVVARGPAGPAEFDADTVFEIGSITKVFTALLLADMALKGEVALGDPAAKYLPEGATMPSRSGKQITLRHLSLQTSGLPRLPENMPYGDPQDPYADYTEQHLLDFLAGHELRRDPGAEYEYSNLGVGLLGYLLARAAGTDYETLVRRRILDPLEMHDTAITLSPDQRQRFAPAFDMYMRPTKPWNVAALAGAGGLRSTADDMLKFAAAALDPASPIGPAMELTLSDRRGEEGERQTALGWIILPAPAGEVLFHGGGTGGFSAFLALQPATRRAVVVLTNTGVVPAAEDMALHLLIGAPPVKALPVPPAPSEPEPREPIALTPAQLDHVTGTYRVAPGADLVIRREGDQLLARITGQPWFPIYPAAPLEFFWRVANAEIRFTEEGGKVTGAVLSQDGRSTEWEKVAQS
jgi:CubicO group peptidase (beta-lactamase class C family)